MTFNAAAAPAGSSGGITHPAFAPMINLAVSEPPNTIARTGRPDNMYAMSLDGTETRDCSPCVGSNRTSAAPKTIPVSFFAQGVWKKTRSCRPFFYQLLARLQARDRSGHGQSRTVLCRLSRQA